MIEIPQNKYIKKLKSKILNHTSMLKKRVDLIPNNIFRQISYNHDIEGEKIADKLLTYYGYKDDEKEKILNLVKYHMHHLYIIKNLPFAKTGEMIKNVDLNDMILMFVSDRLGRGQVEKEKKLNEIEDIEEVIRILERNYDLDLKEIKEKIQKIKKFI